MPPPILSFRTIRFNIEVYVDFIKGKGAEPTPAAQTKIVADTRKLFSSMYSNDLTLQNEFNDVRIENFDVVYNANANPDKCTLKFTVDLDFDRDSKVNGVTALKPLRVDPSTSMDPTKDYLRSYVAPNLKNAPWLEMSVQAQ